MWSSIAQAIGGVGVATEQNSGPAAAHALENLHIPARLALELDALIAGGQLALNDRKQLGNRGLNAKGDAAGNAFANAAEQLGKRDAFALRFKIPDGVFKRGLGHGIAAHGAKDARALAAVLRRLGGQHGPQFVAPAPARRNRSDSPEKNGRSPAVHSPQPVKPFGLNLGQHDPSVAGDAKAGFKRTHQRHMQLHAE